MRQRDHVYNPDLLRLAHHFYSGDGRCATTDTQALHGLAPFVGSISCNAGGYGVGETIQFSDHFGKEHVIEVGPKQLDKEEGEWNVYLKVDHHQRVYNFVEEVSAGGVAKVAELGKEEIEELASAGDFRAPFNANVCDIQVEEGQKVVKGDTLAIVEAMKMQTPVITAVAGTVEKISAELGQSMKPGDKLIKLKLDE